MPDAMTEPVRLGVAGLTHGHVEWILQRPRHAAYAVAGIAEADAEVCRRYGRQYPLDAIPRYARLEEMLDQAKPEAVLAFGSIYDHLAVVQACAPRGIHVMVEKPLAVNLFHAQEMASLARRHGVHLLTNYETTWYASSHAAWRLVHQERRIGDVWKVVFHHGHGGPQEMGVPPEFLAWLTDPILNGGGALIDFGCYGANLMTWLMRGEKPLTVTAVTQQIKPHVYPNVDDEATLILTYPQVQAVVQGSWNWPVSRKDMEVYGQSGQIFALDGRQLRIWESDSAPVQTRTLEPLPEPLNDPFVYLAAVVRRQLQVAEHDLSALANNLIVVEILDAARQSAQQGRTVVLGV